MKKYLVIYSKKDEEKVSKELISDHVEFLKEMKRKLFLSGPLSDEKRAILIIKEGSKEKALNIIYRDPFIQTKYYGKFDLTEIIEANESNN